MSAQAMLRRLMKAVVEADVGVTLPAAKARPLQAVNKALVDNGSPRVLDLSEQSVRRAVASLEAG